MKTMKRLIEITPNWSSEGIFNSLKTLDVPWANDTSSTILDMTYYGNVSGDKFISPLVEKLLDDETILNVNSVLANILYGLYNDKWTKLWELDGMEYNPIENYSMVETMTNDQTVSLYGKVTTQQNNLSHTKTGSETTTPNLTETNTPGITVNTTDSVSAFNSSTPVVSDTSQQISSGTDTVSKTGTEQIVYNTTNADTGSVTDTDSGSDTHTRNYKLERSGNIGVTTSQQMIESERELRMWNFFKNIVFPDIDRELTIQIY